MKKYYKLGLISLVPLPLLSITSCSAETKIEELNITVKQEIAQEIIDKSILDYNAEKATDDDKVIALNQVFIGVNKTNLHQMTITTIKTNGEVLGKIDLKANSGFTFNGVEGDSISASSLPVVNPELKKINITIRKKTSQNVIDKAITTYNEAINDTDKITALNTIFIWVNETNFSQIEVLATPTAGEVMGTIKLTAKLGYTFNGIEGDSISSISVEPQKIELVPIPQQQKDIDTDIYLLSHTTTSTDDKIKILSKYFSGITMINFLQFEVLTTKSSVDSKGSITLKTKLGYTFDKIEGDSLDVKVIESSLLIPLEGGVGTPTTQDVIDKAITDLSSNKVIDIVNALRTVFTGISVNSVQLGLMTVVATPTSNGIPGTIVLKAHLGYCFGFEPTNILISSTVLS